MVKTVLPTPADTTENPPEASPKAHLYVIPDSLKLTIITPHTNICLFPNLIAFYSGISIMALDTQHNFVTLFLGVYHSALAIPDTRYMEFKCICSDLLEEQLLF